MIPIYPHPRADHPVWQAYSDPLAAFMGYMQAACRFWDNPNLSPDPHAPDFERAAFLSAHSPLVHSATYELLNGLYLWYTRVEISRPISERRFYGMVANAGDHIADPVVSYRLFARGALAVMAYAVTVFSFQIITPEVLQ